MEPNEQIPLDQDAEREAAQKIIAGDMPLMQESEDPWVVFPRGLYVDGRFEHKAVVRELTGVDEEALSRYRKDSVLLVDAVTAMGTESIGTVQLSSRPFDERQTLLRTLLAGEREQLFLAISRATFGDNKTLNYTCDNCDNKSEIDLSLSRDFKIGDMKDPEAPSYEYTTVHNQKIEYRLVTGEDQISIVNKAKGLDEAKINTLFLSEVILTVDGLPPVDPVQLARSLTMKDRLLLLQDLANRQPTPNTVMNTECPVCSASVSLPVPWELVFRP